MQRASFLAWVIASIAIFTQVSAMAEEPKEVYGDWQFERLERLAVAETGALEAYGSFVVHFPHDGCSKVGYEVSGQYAESQVEAAGLLPAQIGDLFIRIENSNVLKGRAIVHEVDEVVNNFTITIEPGQFNALNRLLFASGEGKMHIRLEFFGHDPVVWSFPLRGAAKAMQSGYAYCG